jgi:SP family myo-inositol transporter-like MFS transporter 13
MWPLKSSKEDTESDTKIENPELDTKDDLESAHIEKIDASIDNIATSIDNLPVSWFVWLAATTASMAGLLFGYDTGIISGVLVVLGNSLDGRPATSSEKEMITSLCSGGAFIGAIFAGNTADRVRQPHPQTYEC